MSGVNRLLVTEREAGARWDFWTVTGAYANWLEGRENAHGTTTWLVTVYDEQRDQFLAAAEGVALTIERIEGGDDTETYQLLTGDPGTGWSPRSKDLYRRCRLCGCSEDDACLMPGGPCSWSTEDPDLCTACAASCTHTVPTWDAKASLWMCTACGLTRPADSYWTRRDGDLAAGGDA